VEVLLRERRRYAKQFEDAPRIIREINGRLKGLESKKERLLITPKIERIKKLRRELLRMGINI